MIVVMLGIGTLFVLVNVPFPVTGKAALVGLLLLYGFFEAAKRRQWTGRAIALLAVIAITAVFTYDPAIRSGVVGWSTSQRAQIADPAADAKQEKLKTIVEIGKIHGYETRANLASIQSAGATTWTSKTMSATAAMDLYEKNDSRATVLEYRLEQARQQLIGQPSVPTPEVYTRGPASKQMSPAPLQVSALPTPITTMIKAGQETMILFPKLAQGWTVGVKQAGNWNFILAKDDQDSTFTVLEVRQGWLNIDQVSKNPRILLAAHQSIPRWQTAQAFVVFCPPGTNILEAYNAPLNDGASE